ncbi:hypothetical protein N9Z50_01925 [Akkermansiaceae bacterium]|nr:hypothetical protein [Akkermansiaceae bacterium]
MAPMASPDFFAPQQPNTQVPSHHQAPAPQLQQVPQSLPEETYQAPAQSTPSPAQDYRQAPAPGNIPPSRFVGDSPHQQPARSAADPRSLNVAAGAAASSQKSRADDLSDCGAPATPIKTKLRIWPTIIFPLLFVAPACATIYLILDLGGA